MPSSRTIAPQKMHTGAEPVHVPTVMTREEARKAVGDLMRQAYIEHDGKSDATKQAFREKIGKLADLKEQVLEMAFEKFLDIIYDLVVKDERQKRIRAIKHEDNEVVSFSESRQGRPIGTSETIGTTAAPDRGSPIGGLTAMRRNNETIFKWKLPRVQVEIGSATKGQVRESVTFLQSRHTSDGQKIALLQAVLEKIKKAPKDYPIERSISANELARLFRRYGVVE